ncbi:MAP/microtubule affinity-regulating kinase 3-like isoform X2 [Lemur catta]|nr:MAP/microtubule affinity-regulating kinase 3-like isoform X2 [Lemur catta]
MYLAMEYACHARESLIRRQWRNKTNGLRPQCALYTGHSTDHLLWDTVLHRAGNCGGETMPRPSADVWSLGVLLYMFVTSTFPFKGDNLKEVMKHIKRGKYHIPSYVSRQCQKLIRSLLIINPGGRSSLQKIMEDEWLNMGHLEPLVPHRGVKRNMQDEKRIQILLRMGYRKQDIEVSLKNQQTDEISGTYMLLKETSVEHGF